MFSKIFQAWKMYKMYRIHDVFDEFFQKEYLTNGYIM